MGERTGKSRIFHGLISRINIRAPTSNNKKPDGKKWLKDVSRHFSKEDAEMINKHVERCLVSLILRDMQIKTTIRYHLTPLRMATMKKIPKRNGK